MVVSRQFSYNAIAEVELSNIGLDYVINRNIQFSSEYLRKTGCSIGEIIQVRQGKVKMPLWQLMKEFGHLMDMGKEPPFAGKITITE